MTKTIRFQALAFDLVNGRLVDGQRVDCGSPALTIQTAQGYWKVLGHAGAVAFSSAGCFDQEKLDHKHILRRFGQVPEEYQRASIGE